MDRVRAFTGFPSECCNIADWQLCSDNRIIFKTDKNILVLVALAQNKKEEHGVIMHHGVYTEVVGKSRNSKNVKLIFERIVGSLKPSTVGTNTVDTAYFTGALCTKYNIQKEELEFLSKMRQSLKSIDSMKHARRIGQFIRRFYNGYQKSNNQAPFNSKLVHAPNRVYFPYLKSNVLHSGDVVCVQTFSKHHMDIPESDHPAVRYLKGFAAVPVTILHYGLVLGKQVYHVDGEVQEDSTNESKLEQEGMPTTDLPKQADQLHTENTTQEPAPDILNHDQETPSTSFLAAQTTENQGQQHAATNSGNSFQEGTRKTRSKARPEKTDSWSDFVNSYQHIVDNFHAVLFYKDVYAEEEELPLHVTQMIADTLIANKALWKYDIVSENCQHFVEFCKTGYLSQTNQLFEKASHFVHNHLLKHSVRLPKALTITLRLVFRSLNSLEELLPKVVTKFGKLLGIIGLVLSGSITIAEALYTIIHLVNGLRKKMHVMSNHGAARYSIYKLSVWLPKALIDCIFIGLMIFALAHGNLLMFAILGIAHACITVALSFAEYPYHCIFAHLSQLHTPFYNMTDKYFIEE